MRSLFAFIVLLLMPALVSAQQTSDIKQLLSSQGKVLYGDEPNSLVVMDYPENIENIRQYLETVDVPPAQVFIEARVVEVTLTHEHTLGVNWTLFSSTTNGPGLNIERSLSIPANFTIAGATSSSAVTQNLAQLPVYNPPGQSLVGELSPFTLTIFNKNIEAVLKTLASTLDTDVLSAPRITTVNNRAAEIKISERLPWAEPTVTTTDKSTSVTWSVNFEDVGIVLKVTPMINADGQISMTLDPEISEKVSDFTLTIPDGGTGTINYYVPIIDRRTASTKVVIGNGQTLIIGGLIKNRNSTQEIKIPLMGDIPFLGRLFKSTKKSKVKSELLIFVSPTIVTDNQFSQMAKEARFGAGRAAYEETQEHNRRVDVLNKKDEDNKARLKKTLDTLAQQQEALSAERVKLQELVANEEAARKAKTVQPVSTGTSLK